MNTLSKRIQRVKREVRGFLVHEQENLILAVGMFLLSLLSFAGGYLTAREQLKEPITIESETHE